MPPLTLIAIVHLVVSALIAAWTIVDLRARPQKMRIMAWVWPLTVMWSGLLGLLAYLRLGRAPPAGDGSRRGGHGRRPFRQSVALGALHCGAGCALADVLVEVAFQLFEPAFSLAGHRVFAVWAIDYPAALATGIVFQYGALAPMAGQRGAALWWRAFKSDVLSLTAWQVGMYGWMGIAIFGLFGPQRLQSDRPGFWLMMQVAMLCGFLTSYPANWWLLRRGIKEAM